LLIAAPATRHVVIDDEEDGATMFDTFLICRTLLVAVALALAPVMSATFADAQQIVVLVNGEPITALDIEQRIKLTQLTTQKTPTRQAVIEELITEKIKVREARRLGLEVSAEDVDNHFASMAGRMRFTPEQLTAQLARSGVNVATLKHKIRADIAWPQLVRGRYQASLQIGEKDILTAMDARADSKAEDTVSYDYTLRPILFLVPAGSPESFVEARKREAEALRSRFQGCDEGLAFARGLKDVAVRGQIVRSSVDIPAVLRKVLDGIEVGRLTPPEVTKFGVETFAICNKKQSAGDNTVSKKKARESLMAERFEQRSKQYLKEIRRGAMLEYK
jgi:peptidyl-prolyl cis-trans isomerase SurA